MTTSIWPRFLSQVQPSEDADAKCGADEATDKDNHPHLDVDIAAPPMRQGAGNRGGNDLVGFCSNGDSRGNAYKNQQRRHQESAANTEHPGQYADARTKAEQHRCV